MKCPYRTKIVHQPERKSGYKHYFAVDITEFEECYGSDCPYYGEGECKRVEGELKNENQSN